MNAGLIFLTCIILLILYALTHVIAVYRVQWAALEIVRKLARNKAYDPGTAVGLALSSAGGGDPDTAMKALETLTMDGWVRRTGGGRFYLCSRQMASSP